MQKIIVALTTTLPLGLLMLALAACGGGSGGLSGGGSDEDAVRSVIAQELTALRNKDWRGWYDLYLHDSRTECAYSAFLTYVASPPDLNVIDTSKFDWVDVNVKVEGETGSATLVQKYNGKIDGRDIPDKAGMFTFQKSNGSWYDNEDPCGEINNSGANVTRPASVTATQSPTPRVTASAKLTATPHKGSSTTPGPTTTTVNGATFTVEVDGKTTEVRDGTCTRNPAGDVRIVNGSESLELRADPSPDGKDITKGLIVFIVGGVQYNGNVVGQINADFQSGTFSGTFLEPDAGITAQVTGSFTC